MDLFDNVGLSLGLDLKAARQYYFDMKLNVANDSAAAWDNEYGRQGIPSSYRNDPSGVLVWCLANLPFVKDSVHSAVDLGCGTGRNAVALAKSGFKRVDAMDFSEAALKLANKRPGAEAVTFAQGDVTKPLPFEDHAFDLATDIFVYFHQLADADRASYRREIHRILKPGGVLLVSLATDGDGFYNSCSIGPLENISSPVRLAWDPVAQVGNILLTQSELAKEFSDFFDLEMYWVKRKSGVMHGKRYIRETVATLWVAKS